MTQENELTYEEALIAIAGKQPDRGWNEAISFAARMLANAPANIRAALERGPGGAGKATPEQERVWYKDWRRACLKIAELEAERDEWKSRALAAQEAK